jgi:hypothetical protein
MDIYNRALSQLEKRIVKKVKILDNMIFIFNFLLDGFLKS